MSNPVPFQSRDDVLASIRRLVLEEAPRSPGPGRLLLTPALRVAPPDPVIRETPAEAVEPPAIIAQAVAESVSELLRDHRHPAPADLPDTEPSPFLPVDPPEPSAAGGVAGRCCAVAPRRGGRERSTSCRSRAAPCDVVGAGATNIVAGTGVFNSIPVSSTIQALYHAIQKRH